MGEAKPKLVPCPFCGKTHTLILGAASEMWDEDQNGPFLHTETYAVFCDASTDGKKGGCGGSGGYFLTKEDAAEAWNRRSGQLVERVKELEEALRKLAKSYERGMQLGAPPSDALKAARAAISKARPNTAEGEVARLLRQILAASQDGDSDTHLSAHFVSRIETITKPGGAA